jgi:hypothetical protein
MRGFWGVVDWGEPLDPRWARSLVSSLGDIALTDWRLGPSFVVGQIHLGIPVARGVRGGSRPVIGLVNGEIPDGADVAPPPAAMENDRAGSAFLAGAYAASGVKGLTSLAGDFSAAVVDTTHREVVLLTDRSIGPHEDPGCGSRRIFTRC